MPRAETVPLELDVTRFRRDLEEALCRVVVPSDRIGVAVSGGADSMALLLLADITFPGQIHAATVDHNLRPDAAAEAVMVARFCAGRGINHCTLRPNSQVVGSSIQRRAREARYSLLQAWTSDHRIGALMTAHHADDQAETFLMRASRGSGIAGLAGIRRRRPLTDTCDLVRPLLTWRRTELRALTIATAIPFADDPSNSNERYDRVRFRHLLASQPVLLPIAPLAAAAEHASRAEDSLRDLAEMFWQERSSIEAGVTRFDCHRLPREICRRLVRRAIHKTRAASTVEAPEFTEASNVEALLDALAAGRSATQGGVMASSRGDIWCFRIAPPRRGH